jgi:putative heme-binding domain-containing protein
LQRVPRLGILKSGPPSPAFPLLDAPNMMPRPFCRLGSSCQLALVVGLLASLSAPGNAQALDYAPVDKELKAVLLDSSPTESFLSVRADSSGRLFVGGREALFVYEPKPEGGCQPRQELYRFPKDSWVYDIALRGNDVYVSTVGALYLIPDAVIKREGLRPQRIIWGVPTGHVHQCFHQLAWGPEGDLYFSMGDPVTSYGDFSRPDHWMHWTFFSQPEGTKTPYNGVGGVFRCRPDGSHFQIIAGGLRNACGLAFDSHWNLFSNDNDHESMPAQYVPGRMIHVTPHSYFSWPRGWLTSKTPERADMLETMTDDMGRAVPVGQAFYDEAYFPAAYRNNLLVARWCIRAVTRYPLVERGASFKAKELHLLDGRDQARPVGVCVGRGGRVFVTIAYMAQNEGSPVYRSDLAMITRQDDLPTAPFDAYEAVQAPPVKLWAELSDPSWHPRSLAHEEILRRGETLLHEAVGRLEKSKSGDPARENLIWLAAASRTPESAFLLLKLSQTGASHERLQALRALAEFQTVQNDTVVFLAALGDSSAQVQMAGLTALFERKNVPLEPIIRRPARSTDSYLRQAATLLLSQRATYENLGEWCHAPDPLTRLAGVLAAGFRLTLPKTTEPLADELKLDPLREESAYVVQYADKKVDLRDFGRVGNYTMADHWKQGTHTPQQEQLFELLRSMLNDSDDRVRLQAVHFLSLLNDPRSEPAVVKVITENEERRLAIAGLKNVNKVWLAGPFSDGDQGFATVHPPEQGAIDLAAKYPDSHGEVTWQEASTKRVFEFVPLFGPMDRSSVYAYFRLESGSRQRAHLLVGSDDGVKVWQNGQLVWTNDLVRAALPLQDLIPLVLQPGSNDILVRVRNTTGDSALYLTTRSLSPVVPVLPDKVDIAGLAERLSSGGKGNNQPVPAEFLKVDWPAFVNEGNPEQGRKLFEAIGCVKCHSITGDATTAGGPNLADARRRFTIPYLVESVLLPNKQISPVFRATQVQTSDGRQFIGLVVGETADKLELLLTDTKRQTLDKREIEARQLQNLSPMPQGIVKKPEELRDLLAYLLSVKTSSGN